MLIVAMAFVRGSIPAEGTLTGVPAGVAGTLRWVVSKNANSHQQTCPSAIGTNLRSSEADSVRSYKPMAVRIFANHASSEV
jgi:hypothetical protein